MADAYSPREQQLANLWDAHMAWEFARRDAAGTVATMTADTHCNHGPVMTGGSGADEMLAFYRDHFIPRIPPDMAMQLISRTIGQNRVIDEQVLRFTHTLEMDWMLPGIAPTGKRVEAVFVVIVQFDDQGKVAHEHIYWDQATVLAQLGLLDAAALPIAGAESARKALDQHSGPSNGLIERRTGARRRAGETAP
jgi:carboxymethylenebutenolidase